MAITVSIDNAATLQGGVTRPFSVLGHAFQDGSPVPATITIQNDVTGEVLATLVAGGDGAFSKLITGAVQAARAGMATPQVGTSVGTARRAATAAGQKTGTALRASATQASSGKAAQRAATVQPQAKATALRSGTAQPNAKATALRASKTQGQATGTVRRASTTTANDATGPTAGTLSVPNTTDTVITGINPGTSTDNVGITKWKIVEKSADSGWSNPTIDGTWTSISSTTSWAPGASLSFTSSAGSTATMYYRIYVADAAGNIGSSATASATITISGGAVAVSDTFVRANENPIAHGWTNMTGSGVGGVKILGNTPSPIASVPCGARWTDNSFNANHYAEAYGNLPCPALRIQSGAHSCYYVAWNTIDEGDGWLTTYYYLMKVVAGTRSQVGSYWYFDSGGTGALFSGLLRLEASGTTITLKSAASHGGSLTTRITATDSSLSGGAAGIYVGLEPGGSSNSVDLSSWWGGDL